MLYGNGIYFFKCMFYSKIRKLLRCHFSSKLSIEGMYVVAFAPIVMTINDHIRYSETISEF